MSLVVSILAENFDSLARRAVAAVPSADLIELRLDRLSNVDEAQLAKLIAQLAIPVIVAVNGPEAFGTFGGGASERFAVLERAARAGAAFIDIDWRQARELPSLPHSTRRIVSRHETQPTKNPAALLRELRASLREGDLAKLVIEAREGGEALEVLALLESARGDLIAFASGNPGSFTRLLAPILGSPFTYAAADPLAGEVLAPTAPGQCSASQLRAQWPAAGARASTQIFAVLGRPIAHSISPRVHGRALRELELDAVFVAVEVDDLPAALEHCVAPNWRGFAVTAPHKEAAFAFAREHDARSLRARASNTLLRDAAGWRGCNTDVAGVLGALEHAARGASLVGKRALVLGAGGAARAALVALEELGLSATLSARDGERARLLASEFKALTLPWEDRAQAFDIVLQCTTASADASGPLLLKNTIAPGAIVIDVVYRPLDTPLIAAANQHGARTARGAEWFSSQAREQFKLFTQRAPPEGIMVEEVLRALAE